jgi:hypothetical protein
MQQNLALVLFIHTLPRIIINLGAQSYLWFGFDSSLRSVLLLDLDTDNTYQALIPTIT